MGGPRVLTQLSRDTWFQYGARNDQQFIILCILAHRHVPDMKKKTHQLLSYELLD